MSHTSETINAEFLKRLLLALPEEHSCKNVLNLVVQRLAERPAVALARIWIIAPGDCCEACPRRKECETHVPCLHLAASEGRSLVDPSLRWNKTTGGFSRFPIGKRKVGAVAKSGEGLLLEDLRSGDRRWLVDLEWARRESIAGFIGQPILYRGEVLGVLAVFLRRRGLSETAEWLRLISDHLAAAISNARAFEQIEQLREKLELENAYLQDEVLEARAFGEILGGSAPMRATQRQIELVAPTEASVLILGESGTGKELVAREIHARSARAARTLIKVNCASIPRELFESEFFGHVRGSFTGAVKDRLGRFALADRGTLFLDEVGEIPLELQGKLLRVLQEGEYERLGEERSRNTNVRILAATNRDLKADAEAGRFREDLYYRLNVFPVEIAPLRERKEDIGVLAAHFLGLGAKRLGVKAPTLTQAGVRALKSYDWPGNVRELQNVIERTLITSQGAALHFALPSVGVGGRGISPSPAIPTADGPRTDAEMRQLERANLLAALEATHWKVSGTGGAAELLGIKPTTLASRMRAFDLVKPTRAVN